VKFIENSRASGVVGSESGTNYNDYKSAKEDGESEMSTTTVDKSGGESDQQRLDKALRAEAAHLQFSISCTAEGIDRGTLPDGYYVATVVEHELHWRYTSFRLETLDGVVVGHVSAAPRIPGIRTKDVYVVGVAWRGVTRSLDLDPLDVRLITRPWTHPQSQQYQVQPGDVRQPAHTMVYAEHMASPEWAAFRARIIERRGARCQRCGKTEKEAGCVQVHHRTYDRLGRERDADVEVLCPDCHVRADAARPR
jgi:hypothetical protein